jgi:hypothetical protein
MADDKSKVGAQDRSRVAGDERYEVDYFARKHGISKEQAQGLIDKHGNSREVLDRVAEAMKKREH